LTSLFEAGTTALHHEEDDRKQKDNIKGLIADAEVAFASTLLTRPELRSFKNCDGRLYISKAEGSVVRLEALAVPQGVMIRLPVDSAGFVSEEYRTTEEDALAEHIEAFFVKEAPAPTVKERQSGSDFIGFNHFVNIPGDSALHIFFYENRGRCERIKVNSSFVCRSKSSGRRRRALQLHTGRNISNYVLLGDNSFKLTIFNYHEA